MSRFILLINNGIFIKEYKNDTFIEFKEYDKYKHLSLIYPYMAIFKHNLEVNKPALLMLAYDTKFRLQYKYNQQHINMCTQRKLCNIKELIKKIDILINHLDKNISKKQIDRDGVICSMIKITFLTGIRIGKDIHFKDYNSVGLSTLQKKHIIYLADDKCVIEFIGKKQIFHHYEINDKFIIRVLKFLYNKTTNDDDFIFVFDNYKIKYTDINDYIKQVLSNDDITNKDLRTLLANILFIDYLFKFIDNDMTETKLKKLVADSTHFVATKLQNTKAVSKKSYVFSKISEYLYANIDKLYSLKSLTPIQILQFILK